MQSNPSQNRTREIESRSRIRKRSVLFSSFHFIVSSCRANRRQRTAFGQRAVTGTLPTSRTHSSQPPWNRESPNPSDTTVCNSIRSAIRSGEHSRDDGKYAKRHDDLRQLYRNASQLHVLQAATRLRLFTESSGYECERTQQVTTQRGNES